MTTQEIQMNDTQNDSPATMSARTKAAPRFAADGSATWDQQSNTLDYDLSKAIIEAYTP